MHLARLQRLKAALAEASLDCVAAIAGPNLYYLTGISFHLSERPTVGFFPREGDPVIVAGNLEESKIKSKRPTPCALSTTPMPVARRPPSARPRRR